MLSNSKIDPVEALPADLVGVHSLMLKSYLTKVHKIKVIKVILSNPWFGYIKAYRQ